MPEAGSSTNDVENYVERLLIRSQWANSSDAAHVKQQIDYSNEEINLNQEQYVKAQHNVGSKLNPKVAKKIQ